MSGNNNDVFTTVELPTGGTAEVSEGYGRHYFSAMSKARGDNGLLIKFLIVELVRVNARILLPEDVDKMHMRDISYLSEVIGTMLSNEPII